MTTNIDELRESLRGVLSELESQLGGYGQVEEVRDQLAAAIGQPTLGDDSGMLTAFPYTELERYAMPPYANDEMGRVLVQPTDISVWRNDRWTTTTDQITGLEVQMRRADCGAGCRCATEVRFVGGFGQ